MSETQRDVFAALLSEFWMQDVHGMAVLPTDGQRAEWLARFDAADRLTLAHELLDCDEARELALRHLEKLLEAWLPGQIAAMQAADGWVSVEERLPDVDVEVLTIDEVRRLVVNRVVHARSRENYGLWYEAGLSPITHWRPLPPPPVATE